MLKNTAKFGPQFCTSKNPILSHFYNKSFHAGFADGIYCLEFSKIRNDCPTIKCFLRRFVRAAQGIDEVSSAFNW